MVHGFSSTGFCNNMFKEFYFIFIGVLLLYNVVLASAVKQSESAVSIRVVVI